MNHPEKCGAREWGRVLRADDAAQVALWLDAGEPVEIELSSAAVLRLHDEFGALFEFTDPAPRCAVPGDLDMASLLFVASEAYGAGGADRVADFADECPEAFGWFHDALKAAASARRYGSRTRGAASRAAEAAARFAAEEPCVVPENPVVRRGSGFHGEPGHWVEAWMFVPDSEAGEY